MWERVVEAANVARHQSIEDMDMGRRGIRFVLDVALLAAAVAVILTGLLVVQLDLHGFAPHRWAGYVVAVLIAVHVAIHWRYFVSLGSWPRRGPDRMPPPDASRPEQSQGPEPAVATGGTTRRTALTSLGAGAAGVAVGWLVKTETSPTPYGGGDVGLFYHRESSLSLLGPLRDLVHSGRQAAPYKRVEGGVSVALPAVRRPPTMTTVQALQQRRSLRNYADRHMTREELAWVLSAATAITSDDGRRTAPSAGALYPIETYAAVSRVAGVDAGLYHVDVRAQALEPMRAGSVGGDLMIAGLGQDFLRKAPVVLVLTGIFQRTRWKYHERHYRYVCWEGGHIAQNVYLAAESAGLGACMVGAFVDRMVNDLLRVDGRQEAALGLIAVGPR